MTPPHTPDTIVTGPEHGMPGAVKFRGKIVLTWDTRTVSWWWHCAICKTDHPGQLVVSYRTVRNGAPVRFACLAHTLKDISDYERRGWTVARRGNPYCRNLATLDAPERAGG